MVNMSHQTAGFAPYRLDNCSPEVLHVRQAQHTFLQAALVKLKGTPSKKPSPETQLTLSVEEPASMEDESIRACTRDVSFLIIRGGLSNHNITAQLPT